MVLMVVFILVVLYAIFKYYNRGRNYNLPLGPPAVPVVGSLPFQDLEKGPLMYNKNLWVYSKYFTTLRMPGKADVIVIQDLKLAHDLFSRNEFSGRFQYTTFKARSYNGKMTGILGTQGHMWSEQRRFSMKCLKTLGFSKQKMDMINQEEAKNVIDKLIADSMNSSSIKQNVVVENQFSIPVVNVLLQMMISKRLNPQDRECKLLLNAVNKEKTVHSIRKNSLSPANAIATYVMAYIRYIWHIYGDISTEAEKVIIDVRDSFRSEIMNRMAQNNDWNEPRDFLDIYIRKMEKEKQRLGFNYSINTSTFHVEQLIGIFFDLFMAGLDTTVTTLRWSLFYMSIYPEVQAMCQKEIALKIGGMMLKIVGTKMWI